MSSVASKRNKNGPLRLMLALLSKYLDFFPPAYIMLRMDTGTLVKIVFIVHILLVSLLFKSVPLHVRCSLNPSAWPMRRGSLLLRQAPLSLVSSLTWLRHVQSAFPLMLLTQAVLCRRFFPHSVPG